MSSNSMLKTDLESACIENEFLRLEYLTAAGPRIIGLYAKGLRGNLLAETPDTHWATPHGEYYLRGGHRLWAAPENPFYTCPEEGLNVIEENDGVTLKGWVDASGLEKEIAFRLEGNCVHLSHRVTWHGDQPIQLAPWSVTQMRLGGIAVLPLPHKDGLLPDRNIVFWPYSKIKDVRFELFDDMVMLYGRSMEDAFKVGMHNSHGWIAYVMGNGMFVKWFATEQEGRYPDLGCNVEAYVRDTCLELETLGTLKTLKPAESVTYNESWEVIAGEYPTTLEGARKISKQLSLH